MKRTAEPPANNGGQAPPSDSRANAGDGMGVDDSGAAPPPAQRPRHTDGDADDAGASVPQNPDADSLVLRLLDEIEKRDRRPNEELGRMGAELKRTQRLLHELLQENAKRDAELKNVRRHLEETKRQNQELRRERQLLSPGAGPSRAPQSTRGPASAGVPGLAAAPAAALGAFDNMIHLDGKTSFSQMVEDRVAVSPLAMHQPDLFFDICKYLEENYRDPFLAVPPPAASAQALFTTPSRPSGSDRPTNPGSTDLDGDSSDDEDGDGDSSQPKCYMTIATSDGHCQCGKTAYAIVSAWLYYHFCGCHSFLAAWNFRDSPGRFLDSIKEFNDELLSQFPGTAVHVLTTTTPKTISQHMCISATKILPDSIDDYCCNVFVQLNNAAQLKKAKTYAEKLSAGNTELRDKLGKFPVVLLMDEDDENTQTATLKRYQRERTIFGPDPNLFIPEPTGDGEPDCKKLSDVEDEARAASSLAEVAFSYVHISATNHATLIAAGVNGMYIHKVQRLTIPNDYLGYNLPGDCSGWEIERCPLEVMYKTALVEVEGQMVERQIEREEWTSMVVNGCQRLTPAFSDDDHQLVGRVVCQLVCPKSPLVKNLNQTGEQVFVAARNELNELGLDAAGIAVATFHGSNNKIYCRGFTLGEIIDALDKSQLKTKDIDDDDASKITVTVGGTVVSAPDLMTFFRTLFEMRSGIPMYTAIIANYRAGRSVSFKDKEHFMHLTDGFFQKSAANMRTLAHDNLLQALQRPFGRFKHYKSLDMDPPVRLWVSSELWGLFADAMRVHKQTTDKLMRFEGNPYRVGMEFIWEHVYKPKFTKPGVNRALNATAEAEGGYRLVLLNEEEPEIAASYATLDANTELARREMEAKGVQLPAGVPPLVAANRVAIVQVSDSNDLVQLRGAFSKNKIGRMTNAIKDIIKRLVGLEDDQMRHVFTIKKKAAWEDRMRRLLRGRGGAHKHHPNVAAMLEGRKLICFIFDHATVLHQAELASAGSDRVYQEGVQALAWWYPSHNPEEVNHVVVTLAVDLPKDVPTGRLPMARVQLVDGL